MRIQKNILLILLLLLIPITVHAGIICSDGWESSCTVPGPGCCSHHGGIGGGSTYNNYSSNDDSFIDRLNDGEYAGIITLIILGGPIVLGFYFDKKEKKEMLKKIEEIQQEKEEIKRYYLKYLKEMWDEYQKEKDISVINLNLEKFNDKKSRINYLIEQRENITGLLKNSISKYKANISSIKNVLDENLNSIGKKTKEEAISFYKKIFECIFKLSVINDILTELDNSNDYLTYIKYRNSLLKEYSVLDELLSIYRK